jgi:outer membrane receptor protein involved in Fe transport
MNKKTNFFATLFVVFFTLPSFAQVPSQTLITAEEIRERGYDNLDELLASVQGLYLSHDGAFTQIGIRGLSPTGANNQRVQVLLDGVPLNNPMSGQAPTGYDLRGIAMEDIEQVEIIRSPSTVLQGNNAMLGVIKITTKKARKGLRLNFDTGSYGELDGGLSVGSVIGKTEIALMGRLASIPGPELYLPGDIVLERQQEDFAGVGLQVKRGKFSFHAWYTRREDSLSSLPGVPFPIAVDTSQYRIIPFPPYGNDREFFREKIDLPGALAQRHFISDISFATSLGEKQSMEVRLFLNYSSSDEVSVFRDAEIEPEFASTISYDENHRETALWTGLAYKHNFQFGPKNQFQAGIDLMAAPVLGADIHTAARKQTFAEAGFVYDSITSGFAPEVLEYLESKHLSSSENFAWWSYSFFAYDTHQFSEKLGLSGGLRVDVNSQTKPVVAPELNLLYAPVADKTAFRLSFSRGYRLPSFLETSLALPERPLPNLNLAAERMQSYELDWSQRISENLSLSLAFFHRRLDGLILPDDIQGMLQNRADSVLQATGLEGGLSAGLVKGVRTYFNYNFQFANGGKVNMPSPLCKFGVTIPFLKHFTLFTEGQYEGARLTFSGAQTLPFFLMNANLLIRPKVEAKWLSAMSFSFRVFNLLNEFYQHPADQLYVPGLIPQNGRTWQGQLTVEF